MFLLQPPVHDEKISQAAAKASGKSSESRNIGAGDSSSSQTNRNPDK